MRAVKMTACLRTRSILVYDFTPILINSDMPKLRSNIRDDVDIIIEIMIIIIMIMIISRTII